MKREQWISTFNDTYIKNQSICRKQKTMQRKKNIPGYANTRPHLDRSTYRTRPPTADTHKPQIKRKRKGSRDFPFRVGPLLAAGVSRASSVTWAPSARPLVTLLRHLWPSAFTTRLVAGVPRSPLPHVLTRAQNFDVRFSTRPLSSRTLSLTLVLRPAFSN